MAKFQDSVETLITARNEVAGELRSAERQMEATRRRELQRVQEHQRKQQGIVSRLGGVHGTLDVLAGGAGIGIIMRMGQAVENMANKAGELRDSFEAGEISAFEMHREILRMIPVFGQGVRIGEAIQEAFSDAGKQLRDFRRDVEGLAKFQSEELPRRMKLLDQAEQARFEQQVSDAEGVEKKRLQLARQTQEQLRQIEEQRIAATTQETRDAADEASQAVQDGHAQQMRAIARQEREAQKERERAVREADERIRQTRLELSGETHKAEMRAITQQMNERMHAAREAGNRELAIRENILGSIRLEEARASEERRRELDRLQQEREEAIAEERQAADKLASAQRRSTMQQPGLPTLNQERFLTGARQQTEQQDRAIMEREQKQLQELEKSRQAAERTVNKLDDVIRELRDAPLLRSENL